MKIKREATVFHFSIKPTNETSSKPCLHSLDEPITDLARHLECHLLFDYCVTGNPANTLEYTTDLRQQLASFS